MRNQRKERRTRRRPEQENEEDEDDGACTRPRRNVLDWDDHVFGLSPRMFQRAYRLSIDAFHELHEKIAPDLSRRDPRGREGGVDTRVQLAMCLRFLAGASYIDLYMLYHVATSDIYRCLWRTVDAINAHLKIEFPIDDPAKLAVLEAEFAQMSRKHVWRNQVACVDGIDFKTVSPGNAVHNPLDYYVERKGCYAILCIASCDYARRFLSFDINTGPRTHDSLAWKASRVGQRIMAGDLGHDYFVNGDAAFCQCRGMIVPATGPGTSDFNFEQSSNRMPIECAFGMLVRRWGIFWRPLEVRFDRRSAVIECAMKLHNLCIDHRINLDLREANGSTEYLPDRWAPSPKFDRDGRPVEYLNWETECEDVPDLSHDYMRRTLMSAIKDAGLTRPPRSVRGRSRRVR